MQDLARVPIAALRGIASGTSVDGALRLTDVLIALAGADPSLPWLHCLRVELLFIAGRPVEAGAVAAALMADPTAPAVVHEAAKAASILAAVVVHREDGRQRAEAILERTDGIAPEGDPEAAAALAVLADSAWEAGRLQKGIVWAREAVARSEAIPSPYWRMYLRIGLANKLIDIGELAEAGQLAEEVRELQAATPYPGIEAALATLRIKELIHNGQWSIAANIAGPGDTGGELYFTPQFLGHRGIARLYAGDVDAASADLDTCHELLAAAGTGEETVACHWAQLLLRAESPWPVGAPDLMADTFALHARLAGLVAQVHGAAAWAVRSAVRDGHEMLARRIVRVTEHVAKANPDMPQLALMAVHARGALRLDPVDLVTAVQQEHRWARANAAHDLAAAMCPTGDPVARPAPMAHQPAAPRPAGWNTLSEREQEIAELVVQGRTNRQIATRIRRSTHTVNFHLRNIFRKLDIASRIEISQYAPDGTADTRRPHGA
ncbi:LuxR family transcriptional regulator [Kribbella antibiotica]|uniref:LuxR family transcriptional regulator n=1 Tax=Kribbella antibiotica TaxID=190195 RepID=A0A4R4ZX29_9ACTN|nr:helix-turn-helix transcriptional regulator [Kribbella antibiotica]TDD62699.1 LuxR family transcriptional regulator [Kribbella antibiotica]